MLKIVWIIRLKGWCWVYRNWILIALKLVRHLGEIQATPCKFWKITFWFSCFAKRDLSLLSFLNAVATGLKQDLILIFAFKIILMNSLHLKHQFGAFQAFDFLFFPFRFSDWSDWIDFNVLFLSYSSTTCSSNVLISSIVLPHSLFSLYQTW